MKAFVCALAFVCAGCSAMPSPAPVDAHTPASLTTVGDIKDSCDSTTTTKTVIAGTAYFCMKYDDFVAVLAHMGLTIGE